MFLRESRWYCFTDDESGPFSFRQVVRQYAAGELRPGDLVRQAGSTEWQRIETVPQLHQAVQREYRRKRKWKTFSLRSRFLFSLPARFPGKRFLPWHWGAEEWGVLLLIVLILLRLTMFRSAGDF